MGEGGAKRSQVHDGAWDSAFYRFAEGVRTLSGGAVNYKILYAMVGMNGRYVNHVNAIVRKRTAAAFSRLIHSSRYADDFREAYRADDTVFASAATELIARLRQNAHLDDRELMDALLLLLREGIARGLSNERAAGRADVNLARLENETAALAAWCATSRVAGRVPLEELAASLFHIVAFGHLDERFARTLLAATPDDVPSAAEVPVAAGSPRADAACLFRVGETRTAPLSGAWRIDAARPFAIGRYTDCDAIESDPYVSRVHCRIWQADGSWYVEDAGSAHGTRVVRGETPGDSVEVFDSTAKDSPVFKLSFGDRIVLAGRITYWFRSLDESGLGD